MNLKTVYISEVQIIDRYQQWLVYTFYRNHVTVLILSCWMLLSIFQIYINEVIEFFVILLNTLGHVYDRHESFKHLILKKKNAVLFLLFTFIQNYICHNLSITISLTMTQYFIRNAVLETHEHPFLSCV